MHHRFEIQLIVNAIMEDTAHLGRTRFDRDVIQQHVQRYLHNYHVKHGSLPTGRRYLGMTRPMHFEIGIIDFDAIREKIRANPTSRSEAGRMADSYTAEVAVNSESEAG